MDVAEESVLVEAPAEAVYAAVAERGYIRSRLGRWGSLEISVQEPGAAFAVRLWLMRWDVALLGYRLEPVGKATRVSEYLVREGRLGRLVGAPSETALRRALETRV